MLTNQQVYELTVRTLLEEELQRDAAAQHPKYLLHFATATDSRTGEEFKFQVLTPEEAQAIGSTATGEHFSYFEADTPLDEKDWSWQRPYLDWIWENPQTVTLKGRQLGVTWIWAGLALWGLLFKPGSDALIYSIKEKDAIEVVNRIWDMFLSLPEHLRGHVRVLKPTRDARPSTRIEVEHPDGRVSTIEAMAATESAGHSRSAWLILFDEASRQNHARALWKAVVPATGDFGGRIGVVSTANGMSDGRGDGNFFHELYIGAGYANYPALQPIFLGWWLHPKRDKRWYALVPLDAESKAEQYPNDPDEAFLLSGSPYFDPGALRDYTLLAKDAKPLFRAGFEVNAHNPAIATLVKGDTQPIEVYEAPKPGRKYAIGVDNATGAGSDFSVAAVIDLDTGAPCAELHMKGDHDVCAEQVHYLGLWYNTARVAVEKQGGYGDTVIAYLRDGHKGRKPYPKLYRHRRLDRPALKEAGIFGIPMNVQTRPKIVSELRIWVNDRLFPYVTTGFLAEARTFVNRPAGTSPRAADGCNDDRVMAWGIALEMYSQFGEHAHDRKKKARATMKKAKAPVLYPWATR